MAGSELCAAFSEEATAKLTGVTIRQLRYWDRTRFYQPQFADRNRRLAYSRVYSFRDLLSLRVLNVLRNQYGVSLPHLREVKQRLGHLDEDRWTGQKLYVVKKRVVWIEPGATVPTEILSGQFVMTMMLEVVVSDTRDAVTAFSRRAPKDVGHINRHRYVLRNTPVIAGTRIPVAAIKRFAAAGYSVSKIRKEYPDLTDKDVRAALAYDAARAA